MDHAAIGIKVLKKEPSVETIRVKGKTYVSVDDMLMAHRIVTMVEPVSQHPFALKELLEQAAKVQWPEKGANEQA